ncbi:hypothetical protein GCM10009527_043100 [Actinomadura nitritigenes]|uniref:Uncharacterized protein n=1 Tax=Actinomadura nitritigenes TaxID=134602 RepID=A0ABS3R3Y8_9ACTN|nr:hypothetical protein [Actinomadura nitritigenes]MBO2440938.1 hypothetical protein [Actinomadura nitritigenes]
MGERPGSIRASRPWCRCTRPRANAAALRLLSALAPGSTLAMTSQPPLELTEHPARRATENGARSSGTPFINSRGRNGEAESLDYAPSLPVLGSEALSRPNVM